MDTKEDQIQEFRIEHLSESLSEIECDKNKNIVHREADKNMCSNYLTTENTKEKNPRSSLIHDQLMANELKK